ncbi:MAG: hypothetical protein LHV68_00255 [Elusimicrobia bacterium]|nr:hypothetical protein [Candidatus Liberimonas magnetica]
MTKNVKNLFILAVLILAGRGIILAEQKRVDLTVEDLLFADVQSTGESKIRIFGYMNTNIQKTIGDLSVSNGVTQKTDAPLEFSTPYFNLFMNTDINEKLNTHVILKMTGSDLLEVRNMWGNYKLYTDVFQIKLGKIYRDFDLYNSKLDEVPTYLGIEPPELFDTDHLLIPRLTTFNIHGDLKNNDIIYSYSVATDNGEGGPIENLTPLGWDIRANIKGKTVIGFSGYVSSIGSGKAVPDIAVGDGSPKNGVLPWMANDDYKVFGGFAQTEYRSFLLSVGYYQADHKAQRNPADIITIVNATSLNQTQRERFFGANASKADAALTTADVVTDAPYLIQTGYLELGYFIETKYGEIAPYLFWDWMQDPEVIAKKKYGGDNECGIADNGVFYKSTIGVVYRPTKDMAVKLDTSTHYQKYNGKDESYPEIRGDVSFLFK